MEDKLFKLTDTLEAIVHAHLIEGGFKALSPNYFKAIGFIYGNEDVPKKIQDKVLLRLRTYIQ